MRQHAFGGAFGGWAGIQVRHSKYSNLKLADAREALAIVHTMAEDFSEELRKLTAWTISDSQFGKVLDVLVPVPDEDGRGKTVAITKQDAITRLYRTDERAAQWNGNALGVFRPSIRGTITRQVCARACIVASGIWRMRWLASMPRRTRMCSRSWRISLLTSAS